MDAYLREVKMYIEVDKKTEYVQKGGSKFFGSPDVDADFEWPYIIDGDDEVDLEFLCQLNCEEVSCDILPQKGMLYFFIDTLPEKWFPENKDAVRVIYSASPTSDLDYIDSIDENGQSIGYRELKITFETNVLRNTNKMMETMTENGTEITLLKINSDVCALGEIELSDNSALEIYADIEKIKSNDYTDIKIRVKNI